MSLNRLALLPYAPHIAAGLLVTALLGAVGGAWLGIRWQKGRAAMAEAAALKRDVRELERIANGLAEQHATALAEYLSAIARTDEIARKHEDDRAYITAQFDRQAAQLRALANRRPELRQPLPAGLDADILCHWNRAKAGADGTTTSATAVPGCEPDATVPTAADAGGGNAGGDAGRPRSNGTAVSRVPSKTDAADTSRARDTGQRPSVVLPGTQTLGHPGGLR